MEMEERKRTVGETLRAERAKKRLSLDEISLKTRISKRIIKCIEEDKFSEVASPVSLKGFLKIYCDFLGLPFDPILNELKEMNILGKGPDLKLTHRLDKTSVVAPNQMNVRYGLIAAAAAAAGLLLFLMFSMLSCIAR